MSYIPSDFDDLTTGFHILDIRENASGLDDYQDGYIDRGLGYKQQYQVYGDDFIPLQFTSHDLRIDFCYKFQGNKQGTFNFVLNTYSGDRHSQVIESIDLYYIQHSVTQDTDGNEVWLYENFDFSSLSIFSTTAMENNDKFDIEVVSQYQGTNDWYDIASFLKNGHEGTLPEEQPIVLVYVRNPIITNYTVRRKDNISEIMRFEFSGTFDNVYMGKVYNSPIEISIQFINPHTHESELFELVEGEDYTIDSNTFYSGTGSTMSWIDKDIHEVFSEGISYQLDVFDPGLFVSATDSTYSNLPVFDWGRENDTKYLNVNGKYKLNDTDIITSNGNDIILSNAIILPNVYKKTILYNNPNGDSMDITLSDYYTNYEYLEIYCKETWGDTHFSMKINVSTDNYFSLSTNVSRSGINSFMSIAKTYYLSGGQTIYKSPYGTFIGIYFNKYQNTYEYHEGYDILITKVVGYK